MDVHVRVRAHTCKQKRCTKQTTAQSLLVAAFAVALLLSLSVFSSLLLLKLVAAVAPAVFALAHVLSLHVVCPSLLVVFVRQLVNVLPRCCLH